MTRREALMSAMAAGLATLFPGARAAGAVPLPSTRVKFDVPKGLTEIHRHFVGDDRYEYIPASRHKLEPATIEDMEAPDKAISNSIKSRDRQRNPTSCGTGRSTRYANEMSRQPPTCGSRKS